LFFARCSIPGKIRIPEGVLGGNKSPEDGGRCYDHNFLRFSPTFGEEIGVFFSKNNAMIKFLYKVAVVCAENANILAKFFSELKKIITSVPGLKQYEFAHRSDVCS
jgi:hypothetical protein